MVTVCPGRRLRVRSALLLLLTALCLTGFSSAQTLKVNNPGTGSVPLDGNWRFHLGDDKAWADPALDDSGWETIRVDKTWGEQSHPGYTGFAWYRQRIEIDNSGSAGTKNLALLIPPAQDAYEIYWNGQKLGELRPPATAGRFGGQLAMRLFFRCQVQAESWHFASGRRSFRRSTHSRRAA